MIRKTSFIAPDDSDIFHLAVMDRIIGILFVSTQPIWFFQLDSQLDLETYLNV